MGMRWEAGHHSRRRSRGVVGMLQLLREDASARLVSHVGGGSRSVMGIRRVALLARVFMGPVSLVKR
jgi:hypothetical protein